MMAVFTGAVFRMGFFKPLQLVPFLWRSLTPMLSTPAQVKQPFEWMCLMAMVCTNLQMQAELGNLLA